MGFVVAAPEMPESLSASYEPNERVQRSCIVEETIGMLRRNFGVGNNLGIFGHSAGGGTSTNAEGPFPLGRVAIAGFRGYGGKDPLLVVASVGDGIIPLDGIKASLPPGEILPWLERATERSPLFGIWGDSLHPVRVAWQTPGSANETRIEHDKP